MSVRLFARSWPWSVRSTRTSSAHSPSGPGPDLEIPQIVPRREAGPLPKPVTSDEALGLIKIDGLWKKDVTSAESLLHLCVCGSMGRGGGVALSWRRAAQRAARDVDSGIWQQRGMIMGALRVPKWHCPDVRRTRASLRLCRSRRRTGSGSRPEFRRWKSLSFAWEGRCVKRKS